ncbi:hypothetical protein GF337_01970 [candidate division KSB1 bacterium]|nr:hypothetical protein [candidate division KSB1 bacterium]
MKQDNKFIKFLQYEGKLFLITIFLILIAGCVSYQSFFKTPPTAEIRRDYLIDDVVRTSPIKEERLKKLSPEELEIVSLLGYNGMIAVERYPAATVRLYDELKEFQLFYDVVDEFGPHHTVPVLYYFYEEGNLSILIENKIGDFINSVFDGEETEEDTLTERQKRLLMILNEIDYQKHNFLARFAYTTEGAHRNYVSTTTSAIVNFFTGGLSNFNEAVVTRGITKVTSEELVDAGIDILVLIPFAAFFSKSSKAAAGTLKGGRIVGLSEKAGARTAVRSGRFARFAAASRSMLRAIPVRTLFRFKYVKWYVLGLAIMKPQLINHAASFVAQAVSIPPIAMKTGFWFLIFFPLLNVLVPLFLLIRYTIRKIINTRRPAFSE